MQRGNTFGRVRLCVCVSLSICSLRAITFESLDLETSFLVRMYVLRICRSSAYVNVIGSRSRAQEEKLSYKIHSRVVSLYLRRRLVLMVGTGI